MEKPSFTLAIAFTPLARIVARIISKNWFFFFASMLAEGGQCEFEL
jgi:hypothetical protein